MKNLKYILIIVLGIVCYYSGYSQDCPTEQDDCDPRLTGSSYEVECVEEGQTNIIEIQWTMFAGDLDCSAPAESWYIVIQFPQTDEYGVVDASTVTGPGFDWVYSSQFKNLKGTTNEETYVDGSTFPPDFSSGTINVTTTAFNENACTPVKTLTQIGITAAGESGACTNVFGNDPGNDVDETAYGVDMLLPIDLLYFTVTKDREASKLTWETANEINNDYFEIQISQNGTNFSSIGRVTGKGNGVIGNSHYEYIHQNPFRGNNYYRLKQFDYDGNFSYSEIKLLNFEKEVKELAFNVYPIPTNDILNLTTNIDLENHSISIYDDLGRMMMSVTYSNQMYIDLSSFIDGIYFIRLSNLEGDLVSQKRVIKFK